MLIKILQLKPAKLYKNIFALLFLIISVIFENCSQQVKTLEIDPFKSKLIELAITKISLDCKDIKDDDYFIKGWYGIEENGRWSSKYSEVKVYIGNPFLLKNIASLMLEGVWALPCSDSDQSINVYINGKYLGTQIIIKNVHRYSFPIKVDLLHQGWNTISFQMKQSCSPYTLNISQDNRQLAAFFSKISLNYYDKLLKIDNFNKAAYNYRKIKNSLYYLIPTNSGLTIYLPYGNNHKIDFKIGIDCNSSNSSQDSIIFDIKSFTNNINSYQHKLSCDSKNKFLVQKINLNNEYDQIPIITIENYAGLKSQAKPLISSIIKIRYKEELHPKKKPNIILMIFDALRYDHVSYTGYYRKTTPNFDKLAYKSLFYTSAYSQAPFTIHSVASLLTGKYPFWSPKKQLPSSFISIAEVMKDNGYATILVSQTPWLSDFFNVTKGFEYIRKESPTRSIKNGYGIKYFNIAHSVLHEIAKATKKGKPFFMFIHLLPPHAPYLPPEPFHSKFRSRDLIDPLAPFLLELSLDANKLSNTILNKEILQDLIDQYDGNILFADHQLGNLIELLQELNLMDSNIVFILTADHGEEFMDHNNLLHSETLYEELIHVPLLIYYPDRFAKGRKINEIAELIDIAPTILEIIGANPKKYNFDGHSLIPGSPEFQLNKKAYAVLWKYNAYAVIEKNKKIILCLAGEMGAGKGKHNCDICVIDFNKHKKEACEEHLSSKDIQIAKELKSWINLQKNKIISLQQEEVKLPKEEQEKLKALGYVK